MTTRGKGVKGGAIPKVPRLSQSPGPMCKFVTHGTNGDNQHIEKPSTTRGGQAEREKKKEKKKEAAIILADSETLSESLSENRTDQDRETDKEIDLEQGNKEEAQDMTLLPTKREMEGMFAALERSLKSQMEKMERNMGHILERVKKSRKKLITT